MASTADRSGNVKFGATAPFVLFNNGVQRKLNVNRYYHMTYTYTYS